MKCDAMVSDVESLEQRQRHNEDLRCKTAARYQIGGSHYCRRHASLEALRLALSEGKAQEVK